MSTSYEVPSSILPTEEDVEIEALRPSVWPLSVIKIARCERKKFTYMAIIFGFIAFIYSILRVTKDAVISDRQIPASILFLKSFFVTPPSIVCVFFIQKALQNVTVGSVLRNTIIVFGAFFLGYGLVLYPYQETIDFGKFRSIDLFGDGKMDFRGLDDVYAFILTINFFTSSLLYVASELWGNLILSLLFMSFSNDVCPFKQSLRFVPLLYIVSNIGLFLSGLVMFGLSKLYKTASYSVNSRIIQFIFVVSGLISLLIAWLQYNLEKKILTQTLYIVNERDAKKKKKQKIGMIDGLIKMIKSKLLIAMSFIVLSYNICTNLVDSVFKPAMKEFARIEGQDVKSSVMETEAINQMCIAAIVIILLSTPFAQIIQNLGWQFAGLITPIYAILSCLAINAAAVYNTSTENKNAIDFFNKMFGGRDVKIRYEKYIGMIATSGLKISKYAAFDLAKEALCMRFNVNERASAKGICDGICGKLGKTLGSFISIGVLRIFGIKDLREGAFLLGFVVCFMCLFWIFSVFYLGKKYKESVKGEKDIDLDFFGKKGQI